MRHEVFVRSLLSSYNITQDLVFHAEGQLESSVTQ